jgi:hypothetical protein
MDSLSLIRQALGASAEKEDIKQALADLDKQLLKLDALEGCGVDNWQGYDDAIERVRTQQEIE